MYACNYYTLFIRPTCSIRDKSSDALELFPFHESFFFRFDFFVRITFFIWLLSFLVLLEDENRMGSFCISFMSMKSMVEAIQYNLAKDLNVLPCYTHERKQTKIIPSTNTTAADIVPVGLTDLSDHRLVLGSRYIQSDFNINFLCGLSRQSSGVQVLGIGHGKKILKILDNSRFLRVYHLKGKFGMATDNFSCHGRLLQRSTYHHITKAKLDKACSAVQGQHQKNLFMHTQIDSQSQEAYELACKGLIRPLENSAVPILYGVRCIDFNLPNFTLEVHTLYEKASYLICVHTSAAYTLRPLHLGTCPATEILDIRKYP
ncbi:TRUB2 [Acanthosepion pharaonis]|uniref:TRUB2 n=1 Tax=Acanthosepion pharaonis TaxID=158019 RepID=A0A812D495_ACAPH|nr:TRUB2 [Sepia pharaonis]